MGVELDDGEQVEQLASNHLLCLRPASYLAMLLQPPGSLEEAEEENGEHGVLLRHPLPRLLLQGGLEVGHQAEEPLVGRLLLVKTSVVLSCISRVSAFEELLVLDDPVDRALGESTNCQPKAAASQLLSLAPRGCQVSQRPRAFPLVVGGESSVLATERAENL